jgi:hypothetical protein
VAHPAARDDQRPPGGAEQRGDRVDLGRGRGPARDRPCPLGEERGGVVVRLALDVLVQGDRDRARLRRVQQHPHRLGECGQQLLGS